MRFVFPFVVPSRSLNPPMVECYVTIESCLRHIRVSTQGTNECVHCTVMLFLVSHQFNYSPHIFPANLAFLSRGFDHPLFYFSPVTSVMFYPPFTYLLSGLNYIDSFDASKSRCGCPALASFIYIFAGSTSRQIN